MDWRDGHAPWREKGLFKSLALLGGGMLTAEDRAIGQVTDSREQHPGEDAMQEWGARGPGGQCRYLRTLPMLRTG